MTKIILGTDWWTDCDDAVALRLLARAHKKQEVELLGVAINACMEASVASLNGFLNTEGIGEEIPIGIDRSATDYGGEPPYQMRLMQYAKRYKSNADAENAVSLYRRLLAESNTPVDILEIGFLQVVADLLESEPDEISPKSGMDLVKEKVRKIWVMAGRWDENPGKEHNFGKTARAANAGERFCRLCPVPVTLLGWEVGTLVVTGGTLAKDDVLYRVLEDFGSPTGRKSWDPMLVQMALIGDEEAAGYACVRGVARVDAETGLNFFTPDQNGKHCYVKMTRPPESYEQEINALLI